MTSFKKSLFAVIAGLFPGAGIIPAADTADPLVGKNLVIEEKGGLVAVEAEYFFKQEKADVRAWHLVTTSSGPKVKPDGDPSHAGDASGGVYLEILPDTRRTHGDKLIKGENFQPDPGKMAILSYKVHINDPGRYYVWVRAHSTGTEDNGIHVGLDGTWPESGARMQWTAKRTWHWDSKQRTEKQHGGVLGKIWLDIEMAGVHVIQFSMREDGFEFDKFVLTKTAPPESRPEGMGPAPRVKSGTIPLLFGTTAVGAKIGSKYPAHWGSPPKIQTADYVPLPGGYGHGSSTLRAWIRQNLGKDAAKKKREGASLMMPATGFEIAGSNYYLDRGKWLAINPDSHKKAEAKAAFKLPSGKYHVTLLAVGENDGGSTYSVSIGGKEIGEHTCPLAGGTYDEGSKYHRTWENLELKNGDSIVVSSAIASEDGEEWSRARWAGLRFAPADEATRKATAGLPKGMPVAAAAPAKPKQQRPPRSREPALHGSRGEDGDGSVKISGELKQWHKVTLDLAGPYAHELDRNPNPFTDYEFTVLFEHESGSPRHEVPGYFAADGNAANSSAVSGNTWRAHLSPDKPGKWIYKTSIRRGRDVAIGGAKISRVLPVGSASGSFEVAPSDKTGRDFRNQGRLTYVGKNHLQFAGSKNYFLKAGADAPETFLGYADFDGTKARNPGKVPLKTWKAHERDWKAGDPTWKDGKGKGMIGALNYLSSKGANVFSFLPYNAGGDGDNVWPFAEYGNKFQYDCSKLDQWGIVFDHATANGLYLHFKLQETEMDDDRRGHGDDAKGGIVIAALDGGDLGPERKLYCREIIARFGHALALNWNLGEENTQTTRQQVDMAEYIRSVDPYDHNVVIHTFPNQHDKIYGALLGNKAFTGISMQNSNVKDCHHQVVKWTEASRQAGQPWVVAFDEPGDAKLGMPPDPDWPGMPKNYKGPTVDDVRKYTLWGTLLAGGAGVEYYFGYQLPENDLVCENWRSRDLSWDYCRHALEFFEKAEIPFWEMVNHDELVGNPQHDNSKYCLATKGCYVVFLPEGGSTAFKPLPGDTVKTIRWFNPRNGEFENPRDFSGAEITAPNENDWVAVLR